MKVDMSAGQPQQAAATNSRKWLYPTLLAIVYTFWFSYMFIANRWELFQEYWPVSLTMTIGSFVAGATAEGGAAVAFPVFTKVLQIPSTDARTFGLMIQAVGMTMAGVMIYAQRVRTLPRVIGWVSLGGIFGQLIGTYLFTIPNPYPKILFTFVATAFGVAMVISRWLIHWEPRSELPNWDNRYRALFLLCGVLGGSFAAQTGSGIDMLTFIVLTLAFGINEKISTPTTVVIMGLNSVVGFFLHGVVSQDIGIAWNYWLVAVPIVILGAPFGAYVASKVNRDGIIKFLLFLIGLELVTTLWLIPFNNLTQIVITATAVAICGALFWLMLNYRKNNVPMGDV
ncbi:sulfite exporter TauE/SafE family protein [Candidatus Leptofilum sp.]|uniref:sulfite exporter TauE/SafE family protein n=1 Tax=Candidatus Leptofilum sp. TaxID=3241576 RepID=UPI003B5B84D5